MRYGLDVHEEFVEVIRHGGSMSNAADAAGIGKTTAFRWYDRGKDALARWEEEEADETARADDPEWCYVQFYLDIMRARGQCFDRSARTLTDAGWGRPAEYDEEGNCVREEVKPNWKAALAWLERRDQEDWGRTTASPYRSPVDTRDREDMANLAEQGEALILELVARDGAG